MSADRKRRPFLPDLPVADAYGYDPRLILAGDGDPALGRLIIAMGLAYNDLKGAAHLVHLLKPYSDEAIGLDAAVAKYGEAAVGEVGGMLDQVARLFAGILHELMNLLEKHDKVVEADRFQRLLKNMPRAARAAWARVWAVATKADDRPYDAAGKRLDADSNVLLLLRNNFSFHYGAKSLANGFRAFFLEDPKNALNAAAVCSDGIDMSSTRFHFADAAATRAAQRLLDTPTTAYAVRVARIGADVNIALRFVIVGYLSRYCGEKRPFRLRG